MPVFAALDGRVLEVVDRYRDENTAATTTPYDNHVIVDHGNEQLTVYGHLRRGSARVQPGDWVPAGMQLGLTGSSGNSTGPHLHETLAVAPFDVVASPAAVVNRPPNPIAVSVERPGDVLLCRAHTSLATEDPDYQVVAYRYRWIADGRVVRAVRSAGLTDVLPGRGAPAGAACVVTPTDGRLEGPAAAAD